VRRQLVEWTVDGLGVGENQRTLPEVVEQQRRQDQAEPGAADGGWTDMAHVGVKGFRPGQSEEDAAHHREGDDRICRHETERLERIDRRDDCRRRPDIDGAEQPDDGEPGHHDRAEQPADGRGAMALDREQADQDRERHRQDEWVEGRGHELEALHGGEH
jgi:hypothetical protein